MLQAVFITYACTSGLFAYFVLFIRPAFLFFQWSMAFGTGGGEFAWAVDFMRAKPGWPRMPPPPNLNARTAHAYEAARSGDLSHPPQQQQQDLRHLNDSAIGSTPTGGTTTTASGEGDVDSEAHAWLWAGAPSKEGKKEWDEAKRFEAFVNAVLHMYI